MEPEATSVTRFAFDVKAKKEESKFGLSQNQRRKAMLKKQKERKESRLEQLRAMHNKEEEDNLSMDSQPCITTPTNDVMETDQPKITKNQNISSLAKNYLMKQELLEEIPTDLQSEWLCIPIPAGERCTVIASCCKTFIRSPDGIIVEKFFSALPNGSPQSSEGKARSYSVLDCIFQKENNILFVLDMMCWRGNLYYECDTQFRFFFLQSKFSEIPKLARQTNSNPYRFVPLPTFYASTEGISLASNVQHIGFLPTNIAFYNKEAHYTTHEANPLACYVPFAQVPSLLTEINK